MSSEPFILGQHQQLALSYLHPKCETVTDVFMASGAGPGKTTTGCIFLIEGAIDYPGSVGGMARKRLVDLQKTTLLSFIRIHNDCYGWFKYTIDNKYNVIKFSNGSLIFLLDLAYSPQDPEYNRFGSYEFSRLFFDEMGECDERAVEILKSRIRYMLANGVPKSFGASNPTGNWVRDKWIADKNKKPVVLAKHMKLITATLEMNPDKKFVEVTSRNLDALPPSDKKRLKDGDWFYLINNDPFVETFDEDKHVGETQIEPDYPLYFAFDFNFNPCTCIIAQFSYMGIEIHRVIQVNGGTEKLCKELMDYVEHPSGLIVTGDVSGNSGQSSAGLGKLGYKITDYQIIKEKLGLTNSQFKNNTGANQKHQHSRRLMNLAYLHLPITINNTEECSILVQETQNAKVDENEGLVKTIGNDPHAFDASRYLFNCMLPNGYRSITDWLEENPDYAESEEI